MAKSSGLGGRWFINGINLSGDITAIGSAQGGPALLECTGLDKDGYERIGGTRTGSMSVSSWFNPASGQQHETFSALPTADVATLYCVRNTQGASALGCVAKQLNYDPNRANDGSLTFTTDVQSNGFGIEWGHLLTNGLVTSSGAENLAGFDDGAGAATDFGLQLYVQLTAFSGTSVTVTIQDSDDDAATDPYANVTGATSGALTAVGAVRVATGATENVKEYLRVVLSGTYSSATLAVMVVRNYTATSF